MLSPGVCTTFSRFQRSLLVPFSPRPAFLPAGVVGNSAFVGLFQ
ncbi:hypothetical protein ART_1851 [Arthrobacter sp. PAMC 25486]|nr:hypothetical protein ART_1851 [Arthrobacter sp. PAMC 25486]